MSFFNRKEKRGASPREDVLLQALLPSAARVTVAQALGIPAVAACAAFIANTIASVPVKLYREHDGQTVEVADDLRVRLLNDETGDLPDSFQAKRALVTDAVLSGAGYMYINRSRNKIKSLHYVSQASVAVILSSDPIFKAAQLMVGGVRYRADDFLILAPDSRDGVTGVGIVQRSNDVLLTAYNIYLFERNQYQSGGNRKGFIKSASRLTKEALDDLKTAWANVFSNNSSNTMVLNEGLDFKETGATSAELQMNENKRTNAEQICGLFNLSPEVVEGRAGENEYAAAVRTAVLPIITALQTALNRCLLLESEKGSMYFALDLTELLKGDILKRYQAYAVGLSNNFLQIDEVRYKEDLSPLGFNYIKLGLQDVLLDPQSKLIYTPNTDKMTKMGEGGLTDEVMNLRHNPYHDPRTGRFTHAPGGVDKNAGKMYNEDMTNDVIENPIEQPIEKQHTGKGQPAAILHYDRPLNNRQEELLESLPEYDSRVVARKSDVNMTDLSALTAKTGDEFAMFTKGQERLVVRGNSRKVNINDEQARELAKQGYKWSRHTHPGVDYMNTQPSDGDYKILACFEQANSVIYNSKGEYRTIENRRRKDV